MNYLSKICAIVFSFAICFNVLQARTVSASMVNEDKTHASTVTAQVSSEQKEVIELHFDTILQDATVTICNMYGEIVTTISDVTGSDVSVTQKDWDNMSYYFQIRQADKTNIIGKLLVN